MVVLSWGVVSMHDTSLRCTPTRALRRALYAPDEGAETTDPSIFLGGDLEDASAEMDDATLDTFEFAERAAPARGSALQSALLAASLLGAAALAVVALLITSAILAASFTLAEDGATIAEAVTAPSTP